MGNLSIRNDDDGCYYNDDMKRGAGLEYDTVTGDVRVIWAADSTLVRAGVQVPVFYW